MISTTDYFGHKAHTPEQEALADDLLDRVGRLTDEAVEYLIRSVRDVAAADQGSH